MPPTETLREPQMLRAGTMGRPVKVDREKNVLRGYVVAQLGPFKSDGRGEFNLEGLQLIEQLGNASKQGLKSRFTHPSMCEDGLGNYLGRAKDFFLSEAVNAEGKTVPAVRGDLFFDPSAMETPPKGGKPLGVYVLDLAESDSDALSSSIVVKTKKVYRKNDDGTLLEGPNGEKLPPLWYPEKLYGSDIVDTGDAVDGLLSVDGLKDDHLWKGTELLDGLFEGLSRDDVNDRLMQWKDRYLNHRFGEAEVIEPEPVMFDADLFLRRQKLRELEAAS